MAKKATKPELYKVYKIGRVSGKRKLLDKNLTRDEAMRMVNRYPDSNRSMVVFTKG
jgi:hypothetical protein